MDSVSPEELIGLYFDGAATPSERQQAERLLAESAAARAWLSKLEQMQAALKSLPKRSMPSDCVAHVMRQAEQQMLRAHRRDDELSPAATGAGDGWPVQSQRQMWVAMAVAAVALIVVVLPAYFSQRGPAGGVALEKRSETTEPAAALPDNHGARSLQDMPKESKAVPEAERQIDGLAASSEALGRETAAAKRSATETPDKAYSEDTRSLDRKMAPAKNGAIRPDADEKASTPYFAKSGVTESAVASPQSLSYVFNVPTPEAQQAVLETFEETLREQQIVLENTATPASSEPSLAGGFGGLAGGGGGAALGTRAALLPLQQAGQSPDRVYVVEATSLQLSNTLTTLNNLTVPAEAEDRVQLRRAQEQPTREKQLAVEASGGQRDVASANRPSSASGATAPPQSTAQSADNLTRLNRSQAYRFSTQFADGYEAKEDVAQQLDAPARGRQSGATPSPPVAKDAQNPSAPAAAAAPAASSPATPPALKARAMQPQQRFGAVPPDDNAQRDESLQRAVIIFRVVPETAGKPEEAGDKKD